MSPGTTTRNWKTSSGGSSMGQLLAQKLLEHSILNFILFSYAFYFTPEFSSSTMYWIWTHYIWTPVWQAVFFKMANRVSHPMGWARTLALPHQETESSECPDFSQCRCLWCFYPWGGGGSCGVWGRWNKSHVLPPCALRVCLSRFKEVQVGRNQELAWNSREWEYTTLKGAPGHHATQWEHEGLPLPSSALLKVGRTNGYYCCKPISLGGR